MNLKDQGRCVSVQGMHTCDQRAGLNLLSMEQSVEQEGDDAANEGDETGGVGNVLAGAGFGLAAIGQITPDMYESGAGLLASLTATGPVFYLDTEGQGLWFDPKGGATDDIQIVAGFETGTPLQGDIFVV